MLTCIIALLQLVADLFCTCSVIPDKESSSFTKNEHDMVTASEGAVAEMLAAATATSSSGALEPLPVQVIERNRLSVAEIQALPKFRDYSPGIPNKV